MLLLITGSNGLLGQKLVSYCINQSIPFFATSKGPNRNSKCPSSNYIELDITQKDSVFLLVERLRPTAIIHTAALTNVDYCESNAEETKVVNEDATQFLFEAAQYVNAHFQLLSTDFVFDGLKGNYLETDLVNPLSVYAQSKVNAETFLLDSKYKNWSIARTIIVYGTGENLSRSNMVLWALEALPKNQKMNLVNDQFRAPTWADDLAFGCVQIVVKKQQGIFHLAGPVTRSVSEIVRTIAHLLKINEPLIEEISSNTLNQTAKRPKNTGFNLHKANSLLGYYPLDFHESIPLLLNEIKEQN
jgi:dTDP-4-dehydrorhamnose reductase